MPKYIRTENNKIFNITMHVMLLENQLGGDDITIKAFKGEVVIKQADTIEELCDEFVFVVENQGYLTLENYNRAKEIVKSYNQDENKYVCYGAVWTDKGLIYVAKMNSNGELELL